MVKAGSIRDYSKSLLSLQSNLTLNGVHPVSYSMRKTGPIPEDKAAMAQGSPSPTSVEVMNEWSFTTTFPHAYIIC
jgi:hypothetical protein